MTVNFYLDKKSEKEEKTIFAYVRGFGINRTIVLHTGEKINPKFWDVKKQVASRYYVGSPELNAYLISYKERIKKEIRLYIVEHPHADYGEIKELLINKFKKRFIQASFFDVLDMFIEFRTTEISEGMVKRYKVLKNKLKEFEEETNFNLRFNNIDLLFFDKFMAFLYVKKELTNNTAAKFIDLLKTFLTWATERKFNTKIDYQKFKTREEKTDIIYLTEPELMRLYNHDFSNNQSHERVRDVFAFSAFCGARFGDIFNLKKTDIKDGLWELRTQKTRDILKVPLNAFAIEILNKYKDNPTDKALPVISHQKTNEILKEVCKIAGIDEATTKFRYRGSERIEISKPKWAFISFHDARRTFIIVGLEKGLRPEVLMQIVGHSDFKVFSRYVKITSKVQENEVKKAWNGKE